ncbi:MAG: hypothetical protein K8F60_16305 [Melioribacteraceae bacterium]|jgi:hypothetical protein|nr:hypothetical protein [Melioribacteraceae bacterium]
MELMNLSLMELDILRKETEYQLAEMERNFPSKDFDFGLDHVSYDYEKRVFEVWNEEDNPFESKVFRMLSESEIKDFLTSPKHKHDKVFGVKEIHLENKPESIFSFRTKDFYIINSDITMLLFNINWTSFNKLFKDYQKLLDKISEINRAIRTQSRMYLDRELTENSYSDIEFLLKAIQIDYDKAIDELAIYYKLKMKFNSDTETNNYLSTIINRTPEAIKQARRRAFEKYKATKSIKQSNKM